YPYVFLGYALAGIFGPLTGGVLFDIFQNYHFAILIAATASLLGAIIFLFNFFLIGKSNDVSQI
ncbi:MAG: hypothetical protein N2662_12705, partial [Bacteroidales bacterium]|nr:hypothetical protein [Bacteroidales bacterium]